MDLVWDRVRSAVGMESTFLNMPLVLILFVVPVASENVYFSQIDPSLLYLLSLHRTVVQGAVCVH